MKNETSEHKFNKVQYNNDFNNKAYDRINLTVPKGRKALIQEMAKIKGTSVNAMLNDLIERELINVGLD